MSASASAAAAISGDTLAADHQHASASAPPQTEKPMWLTSWKDSMANAASISSCLELADINGDNNYKLIVASVARRLKVFSGTSAVSESPLLDVPVGVVSYYADYSDQVRLPLLAVATGQYIFMYKSLRPYYKFTLPPVELTEAETTVWQSLKKKASQQRKKEPEKEQQQNEQEQGEGEGESSSSGNNNKNNNKNKNNSTIEESDIREATLKLEQLKEDGKNVISARTTDFLMLETVEEKMDFIERVKTTPLVQHTVVTCIAIVKRDREDMDAVGSIIVGTEIQRYLLLLDRTGAQIQKKTQLPSVPVQLLTSGLVEGEYRVVALCRDGRIYICKNGELVQNVIIQAESMITCFTRMENNLVCGSMSNQLLHFSLKGSRIATLPLPCPVVSMAGLTPDSGRQPRSIVVALANNEIRTYTGKQLVNKMSTAHSILGLKIGRYGTEDNCLCVSFKSGVVTVMMLPRTANLNVKTAPIGLPPKEQDTPLQIPKRTNVYVDQLAREREYATDMYKSFNRDICKLRLMTTRSYAKLMTDVKVGDVQESFATNTSLRLNCSVSGLGPTFKLRVTVQNTGTTPLIGLYLLVLQGIYTVEQPRSPIPSLVPSVLYNFDLILEAPETCNSSDIVKVFVCSGASSNPIVSSTVTMPIPEGIVQQAQ